MSFPVFVVLGAAAVLGATPPLAGAAQPLLVPPGRLPAFSWATVPVFFHAASPTPYNASQVPK